MKMTLIQLKLMPIVIPDFIEKIKLYDEEVPLFASYGIESKIESAFPEKLN